MYHDGGAEESRSGECSNAAAELAPRRLRYSVVVRRCSIVEELRLLLGVLHIVGGVRGSFVGAAATRYARMQQQERGCYAWPARRAASWRFLWGTAACAQYSGCRAARGGCVIALSKSMPMR